MIRTLRSIVAAGVLVAGAALAQAPAAKPGSAPEGGPQSMNIFDSSASAQAERQRVQPLNNAPVWREVNSDTAHYTSLPGREMGVLIQHGGEPWRQLRNGPVTIWGGWALVGVLLLLAAFYLLRGPIKVNEPPTGRMIERFTFVERAIHWINAGCFIVLGVTGLLMLFGKHVLLPVFGYTLFSVLAMLSKTAHNFVGPLFAATTIALFLIFVKDNLPRAYDVRWIAKAGGLLSRTGHVPSHRFNAGEKLMFWGGVVLLGIIVTMSGFVLNFPNFEQTRGQMQFAWTWHVIAALLFVAIIFGHIYLGTVGLEGSYSAMRNGWVDDAWAREHHEYWYDDVKAGRIPRHRSTTDVAPVATGRAGTGA